MTPPRAVRPGKSGVPAIRRGRSGNDAAEVDTADTAATAQGEQTSVPPDDDLVTDVLDDDDDIELERRRAREAELLALLVERQPSSIRAAGEAGHEGLAAVASYASEGIQLPIVVLAADIRRSTVLMKEAIDAYVFAETIGAFIEYARGVTDRTNGWFDKFTGDGFLSFWICEEELGIDSWEAMLSALEVARELVANFEEIAMPNLRTNSQNFPSGIGLSVGIDGGPGSLVPIAGDLTVIGPPVVGAVRTVTKAQPGETLVNNYLGEWLQRELKDHRLSVDHGLVEASVLRQIESKEYSAQDAYQIRFVPR